jgi:hypothetical protein
MSKIKITGIIKEDSKFYEELNNTPTYMTIKDAKGIIYCPECRNEIINFPKCECGKNSYIYKSFISDFLKS